MGWKIKKAVSILLIISVWGMAAHAKVRFAVVEVHLSPGNDCRNAIRERMLKAEKKIRAMTCCLTDPEIIDELLAAKKRGVSIEVLAGDMNLDKYSEIEKLLKVKIPVRVHDKPGMMHHNVAIIDDKIVITGSYNWSVEASENCEDLLIIEDREIAAEYNNVFNRIFSEAKGAEDIKKSLLLEKQKRLAEKEKETKKKAGEQTDPAKRPPASAVRSRPRYVPRKGIEKPSGTVLFHDSGREYPYWANYSSKHLTRSAAIQALAQQFGETTAWVERNMGNSNNLADIHRSLVAAKMNSGAFTTYE